MDMLIDGQFVQAQSGEVFAAINPADGSLIGQAPRAAQADVDRAVAAARRAFDTGAWSAGDPRERAAALNRVAGLIRNYREELAQLETANSGKPVVDARFEIDEAANVFEYYAGWCTKIEGSIPPVDPKAYAMVLREPVGVCGLITAWNYPLVLAAWKLAPALAAGCTVVLKPAEQTPLSTLRLAQLMHTAKIPAGVVNVITGFGIEAGRPLVDHPDVDKISFTGSKQVGMEIMARAAKTLKRVTLELGGKSPNILFADAPWEQAIAGSCMGIFGNQGEICSAGSRVLVHRSIYKKAVEAFAASAATLKVGDGRDATTTMGPVINTEHFKRVNDYIARGRQEGATLAFMGELPKVTAAQHCFVPPVIFSDVTPGMTIAREEIFGPVMAVMPFDTDDEAVTLANATEYGLAAALWTQDIRRGLRVARRIRAGVIWLNDTQASPVEGSWGGFKQSGIGRELGRGGLDAYLETKQIYLNVMG
jgi:betaine-aldehyde dehydrogenase